MPTARLEIAYHGGRFAGWAAQPGLRTVQAELEDAIEQIVGERVALTVAGRTDAGVHALAQVASCEHERELPDRLAERLNAVLPRDVAVRGAEPAPEGFDARRDAKARAYRYRVLASPLRDPFEEGRALWWRYPIDRNALDACAAAVVGTHDFTAFTRTQTEHVLFERTVNTCAWEEERPAPDPPAPGSEAEEARPAPDPPAPGREAEEVRPAANPPAPGREAEEAGGTLVVLSIEAPSFMRNQVRVLVGTMLEVGGGRRSVDDFRALLEGAPRERAGETAPPHGLYLTAVRY